MIPSEELYKQRLSEFNSILKELYNNNAIVNRCMQMYAAGAIATKEEALYQMIIHFARDQAYYYSPSQFLTEQQKLSQDKQNKNKTNG